MSGISRANAWKAEKIDQISSSHVDPSPLKLDRNAPLRL